MFGEKTSGFKGKIGIFEVVRRVHHLQTSRSLGCPVCPSTSSGSRQTRAAQPRFERGLDGSEPPGLPLADRAMYRS